MRGRGIVVLDVGKTLSKLGLRSADGHLIHSVSRPNARIDTGAYLALDARGIEDWVIATLRDFAREWSIEAIIPVGHGAAAAIVSHGALVVDPLDYEFPIPTSSRREYDTCREPFHLTGSPALPDALNLGIQLHYLESLHPDLLNADAQIVPWPQYWSWRLSGVAASEVTSLGCHSDLWYPKQARPSQLAVARGWANHLAPLRTAGEVLGTLTPEWSRLTGLPADVKIYCGLHDSNAALLAARAFPEICGTDSTVLSTGTWFIAMRVPNAGVSVDISEQGADKDCLINVDAFGEPIPSARLMAGREIETLTGPDGRRVDIRADQPALLAAVPAVLERGAMILPGFAPGSGPFPGARGRWVAMPVDQTEKRAAICLYAALMTDVSLDLIGAREVLLIEGRFAQCEVFVRALAALRPLTRVYVGDADCDVGFGALRLLDPLLMPASPLHRVPPLPQDLRELQRAWRHYAAADR